MADPFALHEAAVDLGALRENAALFVAAHHAEIVVADVRADGYGHGAVAAAKAALDGGAHGLVVSSADDAVALRMSGLDAPLFSLAGGGLRALPGQGESVVDLDRHSLLAEQLYGFAENHGTRAALRVSARVIATKTIDAGEGVSYGHSYRATARTNLALVALGYADGLDRFAGNTASVLLGGAMRRIVGRVAMNACVVELGVEDIEPAGSALEPVVVDDEAVFFGDPRRGEPSLLAWSAALAKNPAEVASMFGAHLPRRLS